MSPLNLTEPPFVEDALLRQWILDIHNHVYGLGADTTGTLDDDNLDDVIPNRTDTESITGSWTFDTDPSIAGTINNVFTIDSDDTGGNVDLRFGTAVNKHLRHTGSIFEFDDVLSLTGNNITNVGDIALDTISSDSGATVKVILGTDAGDDFIVGNNALVVSGDLSSVGIGTTDIGATQLHIYANNSDAHLIYLENDKRTYGFKVSDTGTSNDSFFITDITAGVNRFVVADGGNVGVGLDNPLAPFHVYNNVADAHLIYLQNDARTYQLQVADAGTGDDRFNISDVTAGLSRLSIDKDGGVITAVDSLKLQAGARIDAISGTNSNLNLNAKGTGVLQINWWDGSGGVYIYDGAGGQICAITSTGQVNAEGGFVDSGTVGVDAGPYTTITSITISGGLVTAITGS